MHPRELCGAVVERLTLRALESLSPGHVGGPIAQLIDGGVVVETQTFSTRYPHIVVDRTDLYQAESAEPTSMTWRIRRVRNQRRQPQINRAVDAANLLFELVRLVR